MYLKVNSRIHDYRIEFSDSPSFLGESGINRDSVIVVDENVRRLYAEEFSTVDDSQIIDLSISEDKKTMSTVMELYGKLLARDFRRNQTLFSIGGGITQDITGFVASTLFRGINWTFIPTTLLAQADSCLGSKTSLNFENYKNLVGSFYPPHRILIFSRFLLSLTDADYMSGVGEIVKLFIMAGSAKTGRLREHLAAIKTRDLPVVNQAIFDSLNIKLNFMADDEFDSGKRNLLNFGHCFGHALESTSAFAVPHGQAVLIGMLFANYISLNRAYIDEKKFDLLNDIITSALSTRLRENFFAVEPLYEAMAKDKKRTGKGLALITLRQDDTLTKELDLSREELQKGVRFLITFLNIGREN